MSPNRVFSTLDNGEIQIEIFNPETDLEGSKNVLIKGFLESESVCLASGLDKPSKGQHHMVKLVEANISDGISLVARHLPTNQIVGFSINKIHSRLQPGVPTFLEEFAMNNNLVEESLNMIKFLQYCDEKIDLYEKFNTDCLMECLFLGVLPEFREKKIAYKLVEHTVELAREVVAEKYPEKFDKQLIGKKPKIVFAIWTSKYSARIGEKLGFLFLEKIPFTGLKSHGLVHPERIPPQHTHFILSAVEI